MHSDWLISRSTHIHTWAHALRLYGWPVLQLSSQTTHNGFLRIGCYSRKWPTSQAKDPVDRKFFDAPDHNGVVICFPMVSSSLLSNSFAQCNKGAEGQSLRYVLQARMALDGSGYLFQFVQFNMSKFVNCETRLFAELHEVFWQYFASVS